MRKILTLLPLLAVFLSGCLSATPFQSARVAESGEHTLTTSIMHSSEEVGNFRTGWTQLDFAFRSPVVGGRFEFAVNSGLMIFDAPSIGVLMGAGFKVELLEDILSFEMPARFVVGGSNPFDTTHFYPRLIGSVPFSDSVELNLSATQYYYARGEINGPVGYSAGLAFGRRGDSITRPEFGVLVYPHTDQLTYQFGISITPAVEVKRGSTEPESDFESTPY